MRNNQITDHVKTAEKLMQAVRKGFWQTLYVDLLKLQNQIAFESFVYYRKRLFL